MMDTFGISLPQFPLNNPIKVEDLIYYEGPILSRFIDTNGFNYFYFWCDSDETNNRWLVTLISEEMYHSYRSKETSLYQIFQNPINKFVYLIDIDDEINIAGSYLVMDIQDLPDSYFPSTDSYYDEFEPIVYDDAFDRIARIKFDDAIRLRFKDNGRHNIGISDLDLAEGVIGASKLVPGLSYEVRKAPSASFQLYLIPQKQGVFEVLPELRTRYETIAKSLVSGNFVDLPTDMIRSLNELSKHMKNVVAKTEIVWVSKEDVSLPRLEITKSGYNQLYSKTTSLLERMDENVFGEKDEVWVGRFRGYDVEKRTFRFQNTHSFEYTAKESAFSNDLPQEVLEELNCSKAYRLYFRRITSKRIKTKTPSVKDVAYKIELL